MWKAVEKFEKHSTAFVEVALERSLRSGDSGEARCCVAERGGGGVNWSFSSCDGVF